MPLRAVINWSRARAVPAFVLAAALAAPAAADSLKTIAMTPFSFTDSSAAMEDAIPGVAPDDAGVHQKRVQHFAQVLKTDLEKSGHYRVIALPCPSEPCASTPAEGEDLLKAAQKAGAALLVIGGVQKMNSLVIFLKATVFTVATGKPIFSKNFTLRGDNDDAWSRGAAELAADLDARN